MRQSRRFAGKLNNVWRCGTIRDGIYTYIAGHEYGVEVNGYVDGRRRDRFDIKLIKINDGRYYNSSSFKKQLIQSYSVQDMASYFPQQPVRGKARVR